MFYQAVAVLLLAGSLLGQSATQSPSTTSSRQHRPSIPGGVRSLKGCLITDADKRIVLVSVRGSRVPLSSVEDLSSHVGQQVRASGTFIEIEKDQPENADPKNTAQSKLHPEYEFRVLKLDVLSQTCSGGKKK